MLRSLAVCVVVFCFTFSQGGACVCLCRFCVSVGPSAFYVCSCARSSTAASPVKRESSPMTHQFVKAAVRGIQHPMPCYRRWGFARAAASDTEYIVPPKKKYSTITEEALFKPVYWQTFPFPPATLTLHPLRSTSFHGQEDGRRRHFTPCDRRQTSLNLP